MAQTGNQPSGFDAELAAVNAAGALAPEEALPLLRKALAHRSNLIVSRAAKHAGRLNLAALTDELAEAFHRFMHAAGDPVKTDPQCWAKNEIAKTLAAFGYQPPEIFLAGMKHQQMEPVWGGSSDTAGPLRGTCALALVQCREMPTSTLLRHLTPLFRDKELPVQVNAARAVEQVGSDAAALLLRLRAELGSGEPELLGACLGGVLRLDGESALPWVASFLAHGDDLAAEAAFALAEQRSPQAVILLQAAYTAAFDREFRATLLTAIASTRLPEAMAWLLQRVESGALDAKTAAQALCDALPSPEVSERLQNLGFPCVKS